MEINWKLLEEDLEREKSNKLFVRVKTCYYHDNRGAHMRKDIIPLKRKSSWDHIDYIFEDWSMSGCESYFKQLRKLEDGIYSILYHESRDWESGQVRVAGQSNRNC